MIAAPAHLDALARFGEALADGTRQRILLTLLVGPAYPAQLADDLDCSRPNISNHLACLRGCGLVVATPEGRRSRYELADPRLAEALRALCSIHLQTSDSEHCGHQRRDHQSREHQYRSHQA